MITILRNPETDVAGWNVQAEQIKVGTLTEIPHDIPVGGLSNLQAPSGSQSDTSAPQGTNPDQNQKPRLPGWQDIHFKIVIALINQGIKVDEITALLSQIDTLTDNLLQRYDVVGLGIPFN